MAGAIVTEVVVRAMQASDADVIGRVHTRAWQETYREVMPDSYLSSIDPAARAEQWRAAVAHVAARHALLVALVDGVPVGFAAVGPARGDEERGEVYAVNVDPDWIGRGVGQPLFAAAVEVLGRFGFTELVLWVVRENARARRFYERNGWIADGAEQRADFGGREVIELRYRATAAEA